jgi:hypothetical protein
MLSLRRCFSPLRVVVAIAQTVGNFSFSIFICCVLRFPALKRKVCFASSTYPGMRFNRFLRVRVTSHQRRGPLSQVLPHSQCFFFILASLNVLM